MKCLFLDCQMGVAGDMLIATLLGLFDNPQQIVKELDTLGIPKVHYHLQPKIEHGLQGYHCQVIIDGQCEQSFLSHQHTHGHTLFGIHQIIEQLHVSDAVKEQAAAVYQLIADAESKVHQKPVQEVHFHEVGAYDAIADVVAVCYLLERLDIQEISVSPIHTGYGTVHCAHGILPVPAPATVELLHNIPCYADYTVQGELCTPTGVALVKYFSNQFGIMPIMKIDKVSYGFGTKQFERPNCVRGCIGQVIRMDGVASSDQIIIAGVTAMANMNVDSIYSDISNHNSIGIYHKDTIIELQCNIDDMTGEEIGFAVEQLLATKALDVFTTPIMMKKQRPGTMITVLCLAKDMPVIRDCIFAHTTTIGIRYTKKERYTLHRKQGSIEYKGYIIGYKQVQTLTGVRRKYEYDDLCIVASALNITLLELEYQLKAIS